MRIRYFFLALWLIGPRPAASQAVLQDESPRAQTRNLPTETVTQISPSRRIFLLTNKNASFSPGDFISLVVQDTLSARAIVAKIEDDLAGIKMVKIYDVGSWKEISKGSQVQVIRGDDSFFSAVQEVEEQNPIEQTARVLSNDQLFDKTTLYEGSLELEEKSDRKIISDNILSASYGQIVGPDPSEGGDTRYDHFSLSWAYQVQKDIWAQADLGFASLDQFPRVEEDPFSRGLSTSLTTITLKVKYTFATPYYSFLMPYLGYQLRDSSSDDLGNPNVAETTQAKEIAQVEELAENRLALGATWLKRLVPGWFLKIDLGTDILSVGAGLEF